MGFDFDYKEKEKLEIDWPEHMRPTQGSIDVLLPGKPTIVSVKARDLVVIDPIFRNSNPLSLGDYKGNHEPYMIPDGHIDIEAAYRPYGTNLFHFDNEILAISGGNIILPSHLCPIREVYRQAGEIITGLIGKKLEDGADIRSTVRRQFIELPGNPTGEAIHCDSDNTKSIDKGPKPRRFVEIAAGTFIGPVFYPTISLYDLKTIRSELPRQSDYRILTAPNQFIGFTDLFPHHAGQLTKDNVPQEQQIPFTVYELDDCGNKTKPLRSGVGAVRSFFLLGYREPN